jgi:hypothetical protein
MVSHMSERLEGFIIEIIRNGAFAKASAIDPMTGEEACVIGPAKGYDELLKRTAMRKLQRKLDNGQI